MQPDVSFVIAAFNAEASLARAVQSALDQRDVTVEVIVVDDCSSDRTVDSRPRLSRPDSVRVVALERNSGPGGARNAGVRRRREAAGSPCSIPTTPSIPTGPSA